MSSEILLCSVSSANPTQGSGNVTLHDVSTGASVGSYKQTSAGRNCTTCLPTSDGLGGIILAAQPDKALLNVYAFQKVVSLLFVRVHCVYGSDLHVSSTGSNAASHRSTGKAHMHCHGPSWRLLCRRNPKRTYLYLGGNHSTYLEPS